MARKLTEGQRKASAVCKAFNVRVCYSRANPIDDIWDVYIPAAQLSIRVGADFKTMVRQGRAATSPKELNDWHKRIVKSVGAYWVNIA